MADEGRPEASRHGSVSPVPHTRPIVNDPGAVALTKPAPSSLRSVLTAMFPRLVVLVILQLKMCGLILRSAVESVCGGNWRAPASKNGSLPSTRGLPRGTTSSPRRVGHPRLSLHDHMLTPPQSPLNPGHGMPSAVPPTSQDVLREHQSLRTLRVSGARLVSGRSGGACWLSDR